MKELSDRSLQERLWIDHEDYPNSSGIDNVVHFLFDDTNIYEDASSEIGEIFVNKDEADAVSRLAMKIGLIVDDLGDVDSRCFLEHGSWAEIICEAIKVLDLLNKSEEYGWDA